MNFFGFNDIAVQYDQLDGVNGPNISLLASEQHSRDLRMSAPHDIPF